MALSNFFSTAPVGQPQQVAAPVTTAAPAQVGIHSPTGGLNYQFSPMQTVTSNYGQTGSQMVQGSLESIMNPNSRYIQQARQRGMEVAATRGGINSSIAAGAAERAALDAAAPMTQAALEIDVSREASDRAANMQNWLGTQGFNREFQGQLAMLPINQATNMLNMVQQFAIQDPALYTPDVVSGYSNFFNENMKNIMSQYFNTGGRG